MDAIITHGSAVEHQDVARLWGVNHRALQAWLGRGGLMALPREKQRGPAHKVRYSLGGVLAAGMYRELRALGCAKEAIAPLALFLCRLDWEDIRRAVDAGALLVSRPGGSPAFVSREELGRGTLGSAQIVVDLYPLVEYMTRGLPSVAKIQRTVSA